MRNTLKDIDSFLQTPQKNLESLIEIPDPYQIPHPLTNLHLMERSLSDNEKKEFSPDEDLFKAVVKKVFLKEGYTAIIPLNELKRVYLAYRDITDVPTLITHLQQAEQEFNKIVAKQTLANQESSWLNEPLPEAGSWAEAILIQTLVENTMANCKVDLLRYLIRFNANRKDISLTEDFRIAETE